MKADIVRDNKARYDVLNPLESLVAKFVWAALGAVVALGAAYFLI